MADEKYSVTFDFISKGGRPLILNSPPMGAGGSAIGFAGGQSSNQQKAQANAWAVVLGAAVIGGLMKGFGKAKTPKVKTQTQVATKITGPPVQLWERGTFGKEVTVKPLQQPFATNKPLSLPKPQIPPKQPAIVGTNQKYFQPYEKFIQTPETLKKKEIAEAFAQRKKQIKEMRWAAVEKMNIEQRLLDEIKKKGMVTVKEMEKTFKVTKMPSASGKTFKKIVDEDQRQFKKQKAELIAEVDLLSKEDIKKLKDAQRQEELTR